MWQIVTTTIAIHGREKNHREIPKNMAANIKYPLEMNTETCTHRMAIIALIVC